MIYCKNDQCSSESAVKLQKKLDQLDEYMLVQQLLNEFSVRPFSYYLYIFIVG